MEICTTGGLTSALTKKTVQLTRRMVPCSFAVILGRSDTPLGKWCTSEYGGTILKLKKTGQKGGYQCSNQIDLLVIQHLKFNRWKIPRFDHFPEMLTPDTLLNLVEDICTKHAVDNHIKAEVVEECVLRWKLDSCYPWKSTHTGMFLIDWVKRTSYALVFVWQLSASAMTLRVPFRVRRG